FNIRTTPEIEGVVTRISADTSTDQRTGQSYYTVRIAMPADQIERLGEVKLLPGMPVEAFMQTRDRTMLSYLIKPLHDQFLRAFREKGRGPNDRHEHAGSLGAKVWPDTSNLRVALACARSAAGAGSAAAAGSPAANF